VDFQKSVSANILATHLVDEVADEYVPAQVNYAEIWG
jgi:hypothetical protein